MESKKKVSKKPQKNTRQYKGQIEVDHDLFRLEPAITKKNISFSEQPIWEPVEHKHMYHSVDSDGKPQLSSCATASHFHDVEVEEINGELVAKCSLPYTYKKIKGKRVKVQYVDDHKHEITYLGSERITQRVYSADALNAINSIKNTESEKLRAPAL